MRNSTHYTLSATEPRRSVRLVYISIGTHIPPLLYGRGYYGYVDTPGSELGIKANLLDLCYGPE